MIDRAQFFLDAILTTEQANYLPTDLCVQALMWAAETKNRTEQQIRSMLEKEQE